MKQNKRCKIQDARRKMQDLKPASEELMKIFYSESTHIYSDRDEALALARSVLNYFLKSYPS